MWCQSKPIHLGPLFNRKPPKHLRCPDCGKRYQTYIRECQDIGCWHLYIPPHKPRSKIPRQKTRHERHR